MDTAVDVVARPDRPDTTDGEYPAADELDAHVLVGVSDQVRGDMSAVGRPLPGGISAHLADDFFELRLGSRIREPADVRAVTATPGPCSSVASARAANAPRRTSRAKVATTGLRRGATFSRSARNA